MHLTVACLRSGGCDMTVAVPDIITRVIILTIFAMVTWLFVVEVKREWQPVCHSLTEDSIIVDCDYQDGGWYKR